jgi:outer membrane protein assembly factor BamB
MSYRLGGEAPLEVDRSILVVGLNGHTIGLRRDTGTIVWKSSLPGGGHGEVFVGLRHGVLVVSAQGARAFRLDYQSGTTLWEVATQSAGRASILIEPELIVIAKGGYVEGFSHDGRPLWSQLLEGYGLGCVALACPGNVVQADTVGAR